MSRSASNTSVFHAIADPTRRAMLDLLRRDERDVSQLVSAFQISQPAISQHLRVLREAGLVRERREGRYRIYQLEPKPLRAIASWVRPYERFWQKKLAALGDYLDKNP